MTVNVERLRAVRAHVLTEAWRQNRWAIRSEGCGTAFCAAGWACHDNGDAFVWNDASRQARNPGTVDAQEAFQVRIDGVRIDIFDRAAELLGLTDDQAEELFCSVNTREEMLDIIDTLIEGATS